MASCFLCSSWKSSRPRTLFMTKVEAESHASQHFRQTKFFDNDCTLDQMFERCFLNCAIRSFKKKTPKIVKKEGRQQLLQLCRVLFDGRISKASPRVTCHICGSEIDLYGKQQKRELHVAINHASNHLGIDLFDCRKCGRAFTSMSAVMQHLMTFHNLRGLTEYFTNKSDDFIDSITTSIKECFSDGKGATPDSKAPMISLREELTVRLKTKGSKLDIERHMFCYRRIRQLAGDDGKIQCRLCSKRINVMQGSGYRGYSTMEHALAHLGKAAYRCKICLAVYNTRNSMQKHLQSAHALPLSKNYARLADKYHSEIMSMLQKCYADETGSK